MIITLNRPDITDAIKNLVPNVAYSLNGDEEITHWDLDNAGIAQPTDEAINAELTRLQAEYDAHDYARKRLAEYPSTKDFMEAYTEKEIGGDSTKWDTYIINYNKVRTENPK